MRLSYRPGENALRLTLDHEPDSGLRQVEFSGYVDVGEGGRLIGIEIIGSSEIDLPRLLDPWRRDPVAAEYVSIEDERAYIELSAPEEADLQEHLRTIDAILRAELDDSARLIALSIPRRGAGYEISYPSGNR